jgi:hypothetical protein
MASGFRVLITHLELNTIINLYDSFHYKEWYGTTEIYEGRELIPIAVYDKASTRYKKKLFVVNMTGFVHVYKPQVMFLKCHHVHWYVRWSTCNSQ